MHQLVRQAFIDARQVLEDFLANPTNLQQISEAISLLADCLGQQGKIMSCGNGGSFCDSMHFAEELTGRFRQDRPALAALALADGAHLSCVANDYGYDAVFSRAIEAYGRPGDVLLAISTSGNSPNVVNAVKKAQEKQLKTIGLLGKNGGELAHLVDIPIVVRSNATERIQELHIKIIHIFIAGIENRLFGR